MMFVEWLFLCNRIFLPPANEVWGKVIFLHLFVILFMGGRAWLPGGVHGCWGACVVAGGHAWLLGGVHGCWGGMCGCPGGMCGCRGACVWLPGCVCGCWGACVVAGGHAWLPGGHAWLPGGMRGCRGGVRRIRRDTVNERAVRILLECILVHADLAFNYIRAIAKVNLFFNLCPAQCKH